MNRKIAFIFLIFFFSVGFSVIFKEPSDCDPSEKNNFKPDDKIVCYYDVAYSYALKGDNESAVEYCEKIKVESDTSLAHEQTNLCLRDIAEIFKDYNVCEKIDNDYLRLTCKEKVNAKIELQTKAEKCGIAFIFPAILGLTFFFRFKVH